MIKVRSSYDKVAMMDMPVTIAATMKLSEWEALAKQLAKDHWPSGDFNRVITEVVDGITGALQQTAKNTDL